MNNNIAKILSILALCSLGALAISHQKMREYEFERTALYYRRDAPSNSAWTNIGTPDSDELVTFTLYLKQRNLHLLEAALLADSDPHSALYGKHWSRQEILDLVAPSQRVQKEVLTWLYFVADVVGQEHLVSLTNAQDAIQVVASVKYTEKLFATQLFKFEHAEMNKHGIKHLGELSVPRSLASYIDIITGVTDFLPFNKNLKQWTAAPEDMNNQCNVPYTIKQLYNIPLDLTVTNANANQSIYAEAFQSGEGFGFGSVAYWEQANGIPSNPINCILGDGAGLIFPNDTDDEAQLDTQMMTGMAVGAKTCFWIIEGWMLDFAEQMFANPKTPLVISASYGWTEWDQCDNATEGSSGLGNCSAIHIPNSQQYVNRTNVEFQKIGLTGRTIVVASGDDGNAGGHSSPNGCTKIAPMFPAASPWVLTVGATSVEPSSTSASFAAGTQPPLCTNAQYSCVCSTSTNEQPAQGNNTAGFDSGGGFSVYSPTPSYQKKAVAGYLASGIYLPPTSYGWNSQGRGYPDMAAVGENFCVVDPGTPCSLAAGTSASAPLIASVMTLLNQDRLNAGKASLGFVNPVIYDMYDESPTQYFNNEFAGTNGGECGTSFGFHSKAGMWSPISGVGSPKFDQIRTYINSLP